MAVLHGGPGAAGEMAPVARQLSSSVGVLEPLQTATSMQRQVEELKTVLEKNGDLPVTLIGFSWGAWLSFMVAAKYPHLVRKLILIGSGGFEAKYAAGIQQARLSRLTEEERSEAISCLAVLDDLTTVGDKKATFKRIGELFSKADAYDPVEQESEVIDHNVDIYMNVWREAAELRASGELLKLGKHIKCPVVAIHGDYDPHPAAGVQKPLFLTLKDFRFTLLKNCGHKPWIERHARDEFYEILNNEI